MRYLYIEWPESQKLMEIEGFEDYCEPSSYRSGAYYVDEEWYNENF